MPSLKTGSQNPKATSQKGPNRRPTGFDFLWKGLVKEKNSENFTNTSFRRPLKFPIANVFVGVAAKLGWLHKFPRDFAWAPASGGAPFFVEIYKIFRVQPGLP